MLKSYKPSNAPISKALKQAGFTLIELVIVIIIIGILAAYAVPKLTSTTEEAHKGVQQGTLGALKSAWSAAYAVKKSAPTIGEVVAQMTDPTCTANAADITCTGIYNKDGSTLAKFGVTLTGGVIDKPSDITCSISAGC